MYCSSCSNSQCFICSVSVADYSHFSDSGPCRLYDDDEARVNAAVMQAQGQAIAETMRSRDDVNIEVLTVDKSLLPPDFNHPPAPPIKTQRPSTVPNPWVYPPLVYPRDRHPIEAAPVLDGDLDPIVDLNHGQLFHGIAKKPQKSYMINQHRPLHPKLATIEWRRTPAKNLYDHGRGFEVSKRMYGTWLLWDPDGDWDWPEKYWWRDWDEKTCALKQDAQIAVRNSHEESKVIENRDWEELMHDRNAWSGGLKRPKPRFLKKMGQVVNGVMGTVLPH
jgi:hypothetical protein